MQTVTDEEILLPWYTNLAPATKKGYFQDSRWFLEHTGYLDPKQVHHRRGAFLAETKPAHQAVVDAAMTRAIQDARADPGAAKLKVLRFIRSQVERVERGELSAGDVRTKISPIRKAFELNEVEFSWKKLMVIVPKTKRSRDREYRLDELQLLMSKAALHLKVAILMMTSGGLRVGAFDYLNVRDVRPVYRDRDGKIVVPRVPTPALPEGCTLLCGTLTVYAGEGDDEYEALISKECYETFQTYLKTRPPCSGDSPAILTKDFTRRCTKGTIRNSVNYLLQEVGLRVRPVAGDGKRRRYEVQVDHGMRKFFDNSAKDHMDAKYVEKLIGHDGGTEEHYDRRIPIKCVEEYLVAMAHLSLAQSYRDEAELSVKLEKVQGEQAQKMQEQRLELIETRQHLAEVERKNAEQTQMSASRFEELWRMVEEMRRERERELASSSHKTS
jgi:hypothetical protein